MEPANSNMPANRIRIFPVHWERAVLFLGFIPVIFAVWDPGWLKERWKLQLVSDLLFLNVIHNVFSFYVMWRSDEIRLAIRKVTDGAPWRLHLRAAAIFAIGFMLYFAHFKKLFPAPFFYVGA